MTASLRASFVELMAAPLGVENPLPQLWPSTELHDVDVDVDVDVDGDGLPASLVEGLRYGRLASVLPCLDQDGYSRSRVPARVPALVLENDRLRATVLPGLGGRLHSLVHVPTGRELLYRNPALQPANLALRNAWFAGGVEWNLGSTGHTTMTCSPMHAAAVTGPDGAPILRLWEWERTRDLPYQLDFWLPDGLDALLVGVRLRNPHHQPVPAYWWSNIAVTAAPDVRVLVPATSAWQFGYSRRLTRVPVPGCDGVDVTYPSAHRCATDLFFELPEGRRPWIAAVDSRGLGVAHVSSSRLRGRKLFVWGQSVGGRRWQEWLSPESPSPGYFEIQAGLATTQLEHLPMPAGAAWHWLEAYVPVDLCGGSSRETWASRSASPGSSSGSGDAHMSWEEACGTVEAALGAGLPPAVFERAYADWLSLADAPPERGLGTGSGWGALELERARRAGVRIDLPGTPFLMSTMDGSQAAWLPLLDGAMPDAEPPGGTLVSPPWRELLERAADGWLACYHRGVARWYAGDRAGAIAAWRRSVELRPSAWALRNLAMATTSDPAGPVGPAGPAGLAGLAADRAGTAELMRAALDMRPRCLPLRIETVRALLVADCPADALELLAGHASHGRCQLLRVRALLALGDAAGAQAVFDAGFDVADLREGEHTLTELWSAVQRALGTERPLPPRYDFSMSSSSSSSR